MKIVIRSERVWLPNIRLSFNSLLMILLLLNVGVGLSGCDLKLPAMPWDPPVETKDPKAEEAAKAEEEDEEEAEPAAPLDETALLPESMRQLPYEEVTLPLPDQLLLYGRLYDPSLTERGENEFADPEEYQGTKYPLIILLHGLNRSHLAWGDLPATLTKAGYAVFAVDLRGHGKSAITTWKRRVNWRYMKPEQWTTLHRDVTQVISFFKKGEDYPEVDGNQVAIIGEKLGANIGTFAAKYNPEVKALVLISPGLEFKGIDASRGLLDYENNTLIMSNQDFKDSHTQARHLYNWIIGPKTLQVYEKIGEGADMLTNQPSVAIQIQDWLAKSLAPVGGPAPESAVTTGKEAEAIIQDEKPLETGHNSAAAQHDVPNQAQPPAAPKAAGPPVPPAGHASAATKTGKH
ncbi:alpha/beta hydrolase [Vampirovibrio sp.]|uniref:alpha/beta hydrolase n=1 Tax=Vampirovibrio sp. TaxID=2717857 RepID=UPI003593D2FE